MASATIGNIKEYKPSEELWSNYKKRLNFWMKSNKIEEDNKLNVLLSVIGADTFDLVTALMAPKEVEDSTFEELVEVLDGYYQPPERVLLRSRKQKDGESVSDYIVELKRISRDCEFTPEELLPNLRDTFTSGLKSQAIQQKLFEIGLNKLTWEKAQSLALSMEAAYNDSGRMHVSKPLFDKSTVNGVSTAVGSRSHSVVKEKTVCGRCTRNHKPNDCPYIKYKCYMCGKIGHIAVGCRNRTDRISGKSENQQKRKFKKCKSYGSAHCVEESENIVGQVGSLFGINDDGSCKVKDLDIVYPEIKLNINICGEFVSFIVDTAASPTVIPEDLYLEKFPDVSLEKSNMVLHGYSGSVIPVVGEMYVKVTYGRFSRKVLKNG